MSAQPSSPARTVEEIMLRCGVSLPPAEFIRAVSNLYHQFEAPLYEELHPEILQQVPPLVPDLVAAIPGPVSAVEIGCGTGVLSEVLVQTLGARLEHYLCSDISSAMLERCRARLGGDSRVSFRLQDAQQLAAEGTTSSLVVTCSVLHHIADLPPFFRALGALLRPGGFYLMLHEPSSRYLRNPECAAAWQAYSAQQQRRRWRRYFDPRNYVRRFRWLLRGQWGSIRARVARQLLASGIVRTPISPDEVARLVDIHDPIMNAAGLGFGQLGFWPGELGDQYLPGFQLLRVSTYGFLGNVAEASAPERWRQVAAELRVRFPEDGANFCALWQRKPA